MTAWVRSGAIVLLLCAGSALGQTDSVEVRIGSKSFTESVILAEIVGHLVTDAGHIPKQISGIGGTRLLWEALKAGQIDVYAEYTGTMSEEILAGENVRGEAALRDRIAGLGLRMTRPLGFNNTYAIGMKERLADERGIRTIGDLRSHPDLIIRFSNEFMQRGDGWPSLSRAYRLPHRDVRGLEHALAYEAIDQGAIHVTDLYATDAKIRMLDLRVLQDDLSHFPDYHAVLVYRADLADRAPDVIPRLHGLESRISEAAMMAMNAAVELDKKAENVVAAEFVRRELSIDAVARRETLIEGLIANTKEHLKMVAVSLSAAVLISIPLGVIASRRRRLAQPILGVAGVIQTIPALALLVMLIKPLSYVTDELGFPHTVVALFLYSLLPIIRNTYAGLSSIPANLTESARALGLSPAARLFRVEMPMASPMILAGIKTAAVINVGFATLGGFIGAGGYGAPIFEGIRLNDYARILQGAVPAALLALATQGLFELIERFVVPKGLRLEPVA